MCAAAEVRQSGFSALFFFLMIRHPPRSTLFPSPTLFRSQAVDLAARRPTPAVGASALLCRGLLEQDPRDRKSTRLNSSHSQISYAVFCLKKKIYKYVDVVSPTYQPHLPCFVRHVLQGAPA